MNPTQGKRKKKARRRARVRFEGICEHAQQLGVSRIHLWKVLTGRRVSRALSSRYKQLVNESKAAREVAQA